MRSLPQLIIFVVIVFILIQGSTFGWRFWARSFKDTADLDSKLIERLKSHVYELSHKIGERSLFSYEKLERAAEYIASEFKAIGYEVEFQEYTVYDKKSKNIIVTREGKEKPGEIMIVAAHYDTCFNPGADDNASGVAALLELARYMYDKSPERTVKFISFVNEEPPFFKTDDMGSRVYTRAAKKNNENIRAAIILESIGYYSDRPFSQRYPPIYGLFYPNKGNFIGVISNFGSLKLGNEVVSNFKKKSRFPIEFAVAPAFISGVDFSDHWSFWKEGYRAVMITDTVPYRNPHYHSYYDTYETLNYEYIAAVVEGLKFVVY